MSFNSGSSEWSPNRPTVKAMAPKAPMGDSATIISTIENATCVAHSRDARHDDAEHDGRDHHAEQLDEAVAEWLQRHCHARPRRAHDDRGDDRNDHLVVQLRVERLGPAGGLGRNVCVAGAHADAQCKPSSTTLFSGCNSMPADLAARSRRTAKSRSVSP